MVYNLSISRAKGDQTMIAGRRLCEAKSSISLLARACYRIKRFFAPITGEPKIKARVIDKLSKIAPTALIALYLCASIPLFGASAAEKAFNQGLNAYIRDDFQGAIRHFTQAIKIDPNNAIVYNSRGKAYKNLGDTSKAIADYAQAIKIDPNYANAYNNRGNVYANLGDISRAIADHNQAIKINPDYALAYYNRGLAYYNLGDYNKAIVDYAQAIKINPDYAFAYYNRGLAYYRLGDHNKAIADCNQAIKINPDYANAYNNRGLAYYNLGDLKNAAKDARNACDLGFCDLLKYMGENKLLRD
jgi:tetratricopeptide (TPR) repeat protein